MIRILLYSGLLTLGVVISMIVDISAIRPALTFITLVCLAYIMIEVGLEFTIDKTRLGSYGKDYVIAMTAAGFPWIFCALYFIFILNLDWKEALVLSRFAAPTSAGVLFTMLAAVGLGTTWLFKKARVLAIFDDIDTILFMIPLQIMLVGLRWELMVAIPVIIILVYVAYRYLHQLRLPIGCAWNLGYAIALVVICDLIESWTLIQAEVLLPAFVLGAILYNPHDPQRPKLHPHEHAYIEPEKKWELGIDRIIKAAFMLFVGASLPAIRLNGSGWWAIVIHVVCITLLMNLGKMFPSACYKKEASLRERLGLSIAMFPRGEVGAGILLLAAEYGFSKQAIGIGELSLALNLLFTGLFIWIVIKLQKGAQNRGTGTRKT